MLPTNLGKASTQFGPLPTTSCRTEHLFAKFRLAPAEIHNFELLSNKLCLVSVRVCLTSTGTGLASTRSGMVSANLGLASTNPSTIIGLVSTRLRLVAAKSGRSGTKFKIKLGRL